MSHTVIKRGHNFFGDGLAGLNVDIAIATNGAKISHPELLAAPQVIVERVAAPVERITEYVEVIKEVPVERIVEVRVEVPIYTEVQVIKEVEVQVEKRVEVPVVKEVLKEVYVKVYQKVVPAPVLWALGASLLVNVVLVLNKLL